MANMYPYGTSMLPPGAYNQSYFASAQGLDLGNPLGNLAVNMLLGPTMAARPMDVSQSMIQAQIMRRRSFDFMRIQQMNLADNAVTRMWGGGNPHSMLAMAAYMGNAMTGGPDQGIVSRFLYPMLGGNPILSQQKFYAGLNGLTSLMGTGLRGDITLEGSTRVRQALDSLFYRSRTVSADERTGYTNRAKEFFNRDMPNVTQDVRNSFQKAINDVLTGTDISKSIDTFAKKFGKRAADELAAASVRNRFSINFDYTYGVAHEDIAGGFVTAQQLGMLRSRGLTQEALMTQFMTNKGAGLIRSAQTMFGGTGAEAMQQLNSFMGSGRMNIATKDDVDRITRMLHSMEATAIGAGIDKSAMLQLTEHALQYGRSNSIVGSVYGAEQAVAAAKNATYQTQAMLMLGKGDTFNSYLRRRGGSGGLISMLAEGQMAMQTQPGARNIQGLLGFASTLDSATGGKVRDMITSYLGGSQFDMSSFARLQANISNVANVRMSSLPGIMRSEMMVSAGNDYALVHGIDTSRVVSGFNDSYMQQLTRFAFAKYGEKAILAYKAAAARSTDKESFIRNFDEEMFKVTGKRGEVSGSLALNTALTSAESTLPTIFAKYNSSFAQEISTSKDFADQLTAFSMKAEASLGTLRQSPLAQLAQSFLNGDLSRKGISGLLDIFKKRGPEAPEVRQLQRALRGGADTAYVLGDLNPVYANLKNISPAVYELLTNGSLNGKGLLDATIPASVQKFVSGLTPTEQEMLFANGRFSSRRFNSAIGAGMAALIRQKWLPQTSEWQAVMNDAQSVLDKQDLSKNPDLLRKLTSLGIVSHGRVDDKKLLELYQRSPDKLSGLSYYRDFAKTQLSSLDQAAVSDDKKGGELADSMKDLVDEIGGQDGLTKVIKQFMDVLQSVAGTATSSSGVGR